MKTNYQDYEEMNVEGTRRTDDRIYLINRKRGVLYNLSRLGAGSSKCTFILIACFIIMVIVYLVKSSSLSKVRSENEDILKKIGVLNSQELDLKAQSQSLASEKESGKKLIEELNSSISKTKEENEKMSKENEELSRKISEIQDKTGQGKKISEMEEENKRLEEELSALKSKAQKYREQVEELREKIKKAGGSVE